MVYFVESSKRAADVIRVNLTSLGITESFEILQNETLRGIADLERRAIAADFIFLDPPYAMREAYARTLDALANSGIGRTAVVIAEHEKRFDPGDTFGELRRTRKVSQGDALSFYRS